MGLVNKTKEYRVSQWLRRAVFIAFAVLFGIMFVQVVFANPHFAYSPVWVVAFALLWGALFTGLYMLCRRAKNLLEKREKFFLACFFVLLVLTQVFFYWQVAGYAAQDLERVFFGAANYTINGFIEDPYLDYFYKFPNNMPLTILLQFVFRLFYRFGYTNFYIVGALINGVCICLAYLFVYLCARRLYGVRHGFFALLLMYVCLPLQCFISVFYTDTTTLLFAPFALYCYLRLRDAKTWKGRVLAAFVMGAGLALGVKIKYSVVLVLIAIVIDILLRVKWKQLLLVLGAFALCFFAANSAFNAYMYAHFLNPEIAPDKATPMAAWIMMGLERDGTHSPYDNDRIWYFETAEEKRQEAWTQIQVRITSRTPLEMVLFLNQKGLRSFGSGNLDTTHIVADAPMRDTFLARCLTEGTPYFETTNALFQGYYVALFGLMIAGAVLAARRRDYTAFVPYLAVLGLYLFLLLWEAGHRYQLNYYGMYMLAAAFGAKALAGKAYSFLNKRKTPNNS